MSKSYFTSSILDSIHDGNYLINDEAFKIEVFRNVLHQWKWRENFFPKEKLKITNVDAFEIYADYHLLDLDKKSSKNLMTETNINWVKRRANSYSILC